MKQQKIETQCSECDGTGLYSGMGEAEDLGIECCYCDGSGKETITYTPFTGRKAPSSKIKRVIQYNPGIMLNAELVGDAGLSVQDWADGKPFTPANALREYACPLRWFQGRDYDKVPDWNECYSASGRISKCAHYENKAACWERWDKENS